MRGPGRGLCLLIYSLTRWFKRGIKLLGRKGVSSQPWSDRPGTHEPRRKLSPRVACKNTWARVEALQRNQSFIDRYREARADHLAGRKAIFPAGT